MTGQIEITRVALACLKKISDRRIELELVEQINKLVESPDLQGQALEGQLSGYRSVRAVGQRYRIIYILDHDRILVLVVGLGIRKDGDKQDIYALAQKLIRLELV